MRRAAWLAVFWLPYGLLPLLLGLFEMPRVILYWDEAARHALSIFGYGLIGSLFYAATGKGRNRATGAKITSGERFLQATAINGAVSALALFMAWSEVR